MNAKIPKSSSDPQAIQALKLFVEKVDKLANSTFHRTLKEKGTSMEVMFENNIPVSVKTDGPSDDQIEACTLTCRFFIQDNEPTSLANMFNVMTELPIRQELKVRFSENRTMLNKLLDGPTGQVIAGEVLTRRRIMEVFVYGGLAHANQEKKALYDSWKRDDVVFAVVQREFIWALCHIIQNLCYIRDTCKQALLEMGIVQSDNSNPPPSPSNRIRI